MFQTVQTSNSRRESPQPLSLSPFSVSIEDESPQSLLSKYKIFINLPRKIKYKITSYEISEKIRFIGQKYGFELSRLANISRLIREYYFGEVRLEDFPKEIEKRMGVSLLTAQEISRYIRQEIIDWDPWGEYIAKLPKRTIREIVERYPKIANLEITSRYIEPRNSEDLEDPTIKNWVHDYVSHLGYAQHTQMQRTEYLFHSKNGMNLSSPDREKLGMILKSFDENIPLPIDEENGEIVFDLVASEQQTNIARPQSAPAKQESFVRPYPAFAPLGKASADKPVIPPAASVNQFQKPALPFSPRTAPRPVPEAKKIVGPEFVTQNELRPVPNPEIDKLFAAPESADIPPIKIHSITEHNEPPARRDVAASDKRDAPRQNIQRPVSPPPPPHPKHKMIYPFSRRPVEPRINRNVVDLSEH